VQQQHIRIGFLLGSALIEKARDRGFTRIVLEGNTKMAASISLYRKLGFKEVPLNKIINTNTLHTRCNIFMEYKIRPNMEPEFYI